MNINLDNMKFKYGIPADINQQVQDTIGARDICTAPTALWFECLCAARYFGACDDLPPGESKLKSFLKSFKTPLYREPAPLPSK